MFPTKFLLSFIVASASISTVIAVPAPTSPCAQVHIIAARASTESTGAGAIGSLVKAVRDASSQTVSTNSVDYPATLSNYASSSSKGTATLKTMLTNQANACPNQKIVLVGYSQGAHIIGDAVAGGGGTSVGLGPLTDPVPVAIQNRVTAIVQMGDPRHVDGKPYNRGSANDDGVFPRLPNQEYSSTLQPRIQNYCDDRDLYCDSGYSTLVHLNYLDKYQKTARDFILGRIGG